MLCAMVRLVHERKHVDGSWIHPRDHQPGDYMNAVSSAIATAVHDPERGLWGHSREQLEKLARRLNVNTMTLDEFEKRLCYQKPLIEQARNLNDPRAAFPAFCF